MNLLPVSSAVILLKEHTHFISVFESGKIYFGVQEPSVPGISFLF